MLYTKKKDLKALVLGQEAAALLGELGAVDVEVEQDGRVERPGLGQREQRAL